MYQKALNEKWNAVCTRVATYDSVDQTQFKAIVDRLQPQAMSEGFFLLTTENSFLKNWAEKNFVSAITQALSELDEVPYTVVIEIDDSQADSSNLETSPYEPKGEVSPVNRHQHILTNRQGGV